MRKREEEDTQQQLLFFSMYLAGMNEYTPMQLQQTQEL